GLDDPPLQVPGAPEVDVHRLLAAAMAAMAAQPGQPVSPEDLRHYWWHPPSPLPPDPPGQSAETVSTSVPTPAARTRVDSLFDPPTTHRPGRPWARPVGAATAPLLFDDQTDASGAVWPSGSSVPPQLWLSATRLLAVDGASERAGARFAELFHAGAPVD